VENRHERLPVPHAAFSGGLKNALTL